MSPCQVVVPVYPQSQQAGGGAGVDLGQAGFWAPALGPYAAQTTAVLTANRGYFIRVVCPRSMTISKIGFSVATAATADDPCDVGIYSGDGLSLLASSGSTLGRLNSTGAKTVNLQTPVALVQGQVYYAALAAGPVGGTAAFLTMASIAIAALAGLFSNARGQNEMAAAASLFPLPAGITTNPSTNAPILALMQ